MWFLGQKEYQGQREKIFRCGYCPKTFTDPSTYCIRGEKPYGCFECSETFARKTGLQSHLLKHTEVNTFTCSECSETFTRASGPQNHVWIHTGESPTAVLNVLKLLLAFAVWSSMLEFIQEKNPINVPTVDIHLAEKIIWRQEKKLMNVPTVAII